MCYAMGWPCLKTGPSSVHQRPCGCCAKAEGVLLNYVQLGPNWTRAVAMPASPVSCCTFIALQLAFVCPPVSTLCGRHLCPLALQVIADHLGVGHKTGMPYVRREDRSAGEPAASPASMAKDNKVGVGAQGAGKYGTGQHMLGFDVACSRTHM